MTKIALLTDTHIGARGDNPVFTASQKKFFSSVFFPELKKRGIDTILHLGDTFDRRKIINFNTLHEANKFFVEPLQKFKYHAIIGNHDTYFTNTNDVNSVDLLMPPNLGHHLYVNKLHTIKIGTKKIAMCPWINRENKEDLLKSIADSDADYLMGHFEITGFEMMKGRLCEGGLNRSIFSKFDRVFSGHFHHQSENSNIRYLGAPYEMNWSDYDGNRGFHIFDVETGDLEFIQNPYRMFHKLSYDDTDLTIHDLAHLEFDKDLEGTYVKVLVKAKTNVHFFETYLSKLNLVGAAEVKVVEDAIDLDNVEIDETVGELKDTRDLMFHYVESMEDLDEKKSSSLRRKLSELYDEALTIQ